MTETSISIINIRSDWEHFLQTGTVVRRKVSPRWSSVWKDPSSRVHLEHARFWTIEGKGRIGAFYLPSDHIGFLGWYECIDDPQIAAHLIHTAVEWLENKNCSKIIGPINGSSWYPYRFNLDSEHPLFAGEPFQPAFYLDQWKSAGFFPSIYYHSSAIDLAASGGIGESDFQLFLEELGLQRLPLDTDNYLRQKGQILDLLNECFQVNPLFESLEIEEFSWIFDRLPGGLQQDLSFLLLDTEGSLVGLYLSYPDSLHPKHEGNPEAKDLEKSPKLIVKTVATHPKWQGKQIGSQVVRYLHCQGRKMGMTHAIHALMYLKNISFSTTQRKFPSHTVRTYALLEKRL